MIVQMDPDKEGGEPFEAESSPHLAGEPFEAESSPFRFYFTGVFVRRKLDRLNYWDTIQNRSLFYKTLPETHI